MVYLSFCLGLILLIGGGELLIRNGVSLANRMHLSKLVIGIVLMGFGTSLPEFFTSISAILAKPPIPEIAFGNVIGSNISNILLVLGLATLISPITIKKSGFRRDSLFMIMSILILGLIMLFNYLDIITGLFFICFILCYFFACYNTKRDNSKIKQTQKLTKPVWLLILLSCISIVLIIFGAQQLVYSITDIATIWGLSKSILGLTLVAVGTSLPELTVSTIAALHKQGDIALGNVIGSNITNIFLIVGVMGFMHQTNIPQMWFSFFVMSIATIILLICGKYGKIPRYMGFCFLIAYITYVYMLI